ncbi:MCE family protein [Sulfidibacter corallicola]|uniref:MCE family protein n=1 Tax=Sulfidibacter corallicola TaxID=2818388 RepID=A0A8A4TN77_SULCO|nr:MlaD family protein [Sulfidibacter corallicola]QTD51000.1 MCE family protein [Sulfidibacter corallicola]
MNREAKVGLFVLIAVGVMIFFVFKTSDLAAALKREAPLREQRVILSDASGIREDTAVRVAGVKVGRVLRIELMGSEAVATLGLPADLELGTDAYTELRSQGVLGEKFIALFPGSEGRLGADQSLRTVVPPSLEDLTATFNAIGQNFQGITESLKASTVAADGGNRIEAIAANLEKMSALLVAMMEENRTNIKTTTGEFASMTQNLNRDLPAMVAELRALAQSLRETSQANRPNIDQTMQNVAAMSEKFNRASASLAELTAKVERGEGSIGKLFNDPTTVDNLNQVLETANDSLGKIDQFLGSADALKFDLHVRSEYLSEHSTAKTYFGLRIKPSDDKFYLLEGVSRDADHLPGELTQTTSETFDPDGNLVSRTVISSLEEADDLEFTGQLAYRVRGGLFVRGGLIEGEGGAGLDYFAMGDQLQLSLEGFDFNRENDLGTHAKAGLSFKLKHGLHLTAGWDDFLEESLDSAFVGGGIRWKDDDLKILITNLGSVLRR